MTITVGAIHESPVYSMQKMMRAIHELPVRMLFILIGLLFLSACNPVTQTDARLFYFGTVIEIRVYGERDPQPVLSEIESNLKQWHTRFHAWQPSELTELNTTLQRGASITPADDMAIIIRRAHDLAEQSEQLFNPALGKRIAAWGFARDNMNDTTATPKTIDPKSLPTMRDLHWQGKQLRSSNPDLQLDLGGIAKGYALDEILNLLRARGFRNAMINIGGDIGVLGQTPQRPWHIAIQNPDGSNTPLATITLNDGEMAFTSGTYARQHATENGNAHHIIDPRNGAPSQGNIAVTLVGRDGMLLQAACKVLLIAGNDWQRYADKLNVANAYVVNKKSTIELTATMMTLIDHAQTTQWRVVEASPERDD